MTRDQMDITISERNRLLDIIAGHPADTNKYAFDYYVERYTVNGETDFKKVAIFLMQYSYQDGWKRAYQMYQDWLGKQNQDQYIVYLLPFSCPVIKKLCEMDEFEKQCCYNHWLEKKVHKSFF